MTLKQITENGNGKIIGGCAITLLVALIMFTFGSWRAQNTALASDLRDNRAFTQDVNDRTLVADAQYEIEIKYIKEALVRIEEKLDDANKLIKETF